jgi:SDR family mycofactocin-dependent oxidoreductase
LTEALSGRVALITGAARGQGRAHAVRLAREGADILGLDICADIPTMDIPNATPEDLQETVRLVEAEGRRMIARIGDVRDFSALTRLVDEGRAEFGHLDIVVANAGQVRFGTEVDPVNEWNDVIGVNLTGVYYTVRAAIPAIIEGGRGGSVVVIGSTAAVRGCSSDVAGGLAYTASKRGLVGLVRQLAQGLAEHWIRVNIVHPTGVDTPMLDNEAMKAWFASGQGRSGRNALPVRVLQPSDIAAAVAWLVSDEARYVTGIEMPVDAGFCLG